MQSSNNLIMFCYLFTFVVVIVVFIIIITVSAVVAANVWNGPSSRL